ncbi:hypothetical protein CJ030_MR1G028216 [Morella rubra]|uniref:Uncharacterized protein n=1 Tax=Morella rubra TaxID=262757 RepID=A0A6A1WP64_9ROSI|nr:hypothetical protein CJ030_MR1G028216 [Morella rubra]
MFGFVVPAAIRLHGGDVPTSPSGAPFLLPVNFETFPACPSHHLLLSRRLISFFLSWVILLPLAIAFSVPGVMKNLEIEMERLIHKTEALNWESNPPKVCQDVEAWTFTKQLEVKELETNSFLFEFLRPAYHDYVLLRCSWNIKGNVMVVKQQESGLSWWEIDLNSTLCGFRFMVCRWTDQMK